MFLENVVFDATDPHELGRAWEARLGTTVLTDDEGGYETRLAVEGGPVLDLCFQPVPEPPSERQRLSLVVDDGPGVLVALRLEVADPQRDRDFWAWLTGWLPLFERKRLVMLVTFSSACLNSARSAAGREPGFCEAR